MDFYPDTYSKIALALTSAQVAKETLVAEKGVGNDLPFNFFGWDESTLSMVVQLSPERMKDPMAKRFELCSGALHAMRAYFGCDELTFVAEGFHSSKPELTSGKNMKELYEDGCPYVKESLTCTHVELNDFMDPEATFVSATYQYLANQWIVWDDEKAYTRGIGRVLRDVPFPAMMAASLRTQFEDPDDEEIFRVMELMMNNGFNVQQIL